VAVTVMDVVKEGITHTRVAIISSGRRQSPSGTWLTEQPSPDDQPIIVDRSGSEGSGAGSSYIAKEDRVVRDAGSRRFTVTPKVLRHTLKGHPSTEWVDSTTRSALLTSHNLAR